MTAGVPGTGIGGLFYMIAAVLLPIRELRRRIRGLRAPWSTIAVQVALALGIFLGIWATGWLLGLLIQPAGVKTDFGSAVDIARRKTTNLVRWAALAAGFLNLSGVLLVTQVARLVVRRRRKKNAAALFLAFFLLSLPFALPTSGQTQAADLLRKADAAFKDEDRALAERLYRQVLALDAYQSRAVYRLGVLATDDRTALSWFRRYVELEPGDAWGWLAVGERLLKLGKAVEAVEALDRATQLAPGAEDVRDRSTKARLRAAPAIEPLLGGTEDSDGNSILCFGARGDIAVRGGLRLGGLLRRSMIGDGTAKAVLDEAGILVKGRPFQSFSLAGTAGLARFNAHDGKGWTTPEADLRLRWRPSTTSPSLDARLLRMPFGNSPLLVANRVMRNEARLGLEVPAGPVRLRGTARLSVIEAKGEKSNRRFQVDTSVSAPLTPQGEVSIQFHSLGFSRASAAGYFAPGRVETLEVGTYWSLEGDGRLSAEIDLGAGIQCLAKQNEEIGPWKTALRGWALLAFDLSSTVQLRAEAEAYSSPYAPIGVATAPDWKYGSINAGLLVRVR